MARKITTEAINAFLAGNKFNKDNTRVSVDGSMSDLFLHDNKIATVAKLSTGGVEIWVTNAGWFTTTTKERLNGIPGVRVNQSKGVWYLNGEEWDGGWKKI